MKRFTYKKYKRPDVTYTDKLQNNPELIKQILEGYEEIDNIDNISKGRHVRYITLKNNKPVIRIGGFITFIHPKYVKFANNGFSWSVQRFHYDSNGKYIGATRFFQLSSDLEECEQAILEQHDKIEEQTQKINVLEKQKKYLIGVIKKERSSLRKK